MDATRSNSTLNIQHSTFTIQRMKLHLGSGPHHIDGWVNIDNQAYAGVDSVLDVTREFPFEDVSFVFAEHFIEQRDDGVLRLSTPDLDWVWASHYRRVLNDEEQVLGCFALNRAFRGWGHQFL